MQLVCRALLVLGLVMLIYATRRGQVSCSKFKNRKAGLVLDPLVPLPVINPSVSNIANMSLTPWAYRYSFEDSRVPSRIAEAQCLTSGCLTLNGEGEHAALVAKPIYYDVLVLHRVQRKRQTRKGGTRARNKYDFMLGVERVPVGCTCVRPTIIPQP